MKRILFLIMYVFFAIAGLSCSSSTIADKNAQLIQAVYYKNIQGVQTSLLNGADVNASSFDGKTALYMAAQNNDIDFVKLLLDNGADAEKGYNGKTALYVAADNNCAGIVKLLLDNGANPNTRDKSDITILRLACSKGYIEVVKLLLDKGADVNTKAYSDGGTALMMASQNGYAELVRLLLGKGADINVKSNEGITALWAAAHEGNIEVVKLLLEKGADVNAKRTSDGQTALYAAWQKGCTDVVMLLTNGKVVASPVNLSDVEVSQLSEKIAAKIAPFTLGELRSGLPDKLGNPSGLISYSTKRWSTIRTRLEGTKNVKVIAEVRADGSNKIQGVDIYVKQDQNNVSTTDFLYGNIGGKVAIFNQPLPTQSDQIGFNEVWLENSGTITQYKRTKDGKWEAKSYKNVDK